MSSIAIDGIRKCASSISTSITHKQLTTTTACPLANRCRKNKSKKKTQGSDARKPTRIVTNINNIHKVNHQRNYHNREKPTSWCTLKAPLITLAQTCTTPAWKRFPCFSCRRCPSKKVSKIARRDVGLGMPIANTKKCRWSRGFI